MNKRQLSEFDKYKLDKKREVLFLMSSLSIVTLIFVLFIHQVIIKSVLVIAALFAAYGIGEWNIRQKNKRKQAIERKI